MLMKCRERDKETRQFHGTGAVLGPFSRHAKARIYTQIPSLALQS